MPKAIADRYGIEPGTDLEWLEAGDAIRVVPHRDRRDDDADVAERLRRYDESTRRLLRYAEQRPLAPSRDRGWTREELYERGSAR